MSSKRARVASDDDGANSLLSGFGNEFATEALQVVFRMYLERYVGNQCHHGLRSFVFKK